MSAEHTAHGEGHHHHITPLSHYFAVFGALLVLTAVTVWIAQFHFGAANTLIAMLVATIKASLVALIFMHLLYDDRLNSLTFLFGLLFVALFFIFTLTDVYTRGFIDPVRDNHYLRDEQVAQLKLAAEAQQDLPAQYPKKTIGEDYPVAEDERVNPPAPPPPPAPPAAPATDAEGNVIAAPEEAPKPAFAVDPAKAEQGKALFASKTCAACHSLDGSKLVGPTMKGIWGRKEVMADGSEVIVDQAYWLESIKTPNAKVVKDFPPAMPVLPVSDEEAEAILHYVNSL
ncbi:MAG: cytochrome C oxidase subunit IV family protein [Myxococcales bacterium]|nr:cytochrome C oxidase subunit IV family protein [Myxococcales bacterium]